MWQHQAITWTDVDKLSIFFLEKGFWNLTRSSFHMDSDFFRKHSFCVTIAISSHAMLERLIVWFINKIDQINPLCSNAYHKRYILIIFAASFSLYMYMQKITTTRLGDTISYICAGSSVEPLWGLCLINLCNQICNIVLVRKEKYLIIAFAERVKKDIADNFHSDPEDIKLGANRTTDFVFFI